MKEYIEKEATIKRFTFATLDCLGMEPQIRASDVVKAIDAIPAADVVEVVRCGECMFWDAPPSCEGLARCRTGESGVRFRKAYDFCSRGRKKMDGGVNDAAD
jgi:hypothetical protein